MERLAAMEARIRSLHQLHEVIGAMRSLAAAHLQQASEALPAARAYVSIVDAAFAEALALARDTETSPPSDEDTAQPDTPPSPAGPSPTSLGLVVFTAEHGFVGGFNHRLTEEIRAIAPRRLFVVGTRGAAVLREAGLSLDWWGAAAVDTRTVMEVGRRITDDVYALFDRQILARLDMLFGRLLENGTWTLVREPLLPLAPALSPRSTAPPPLHYLTPPALLERLVEEHLLADMVRGTTEALAAENAARLHAMSNAFDNIDRKLDDLEAEARRVRQEQITEELLDLISVRRGDPP